MTPKIQAKDLVNEFRVYCTSTQIINQDQSEYTEIKYAKQCAIIAVNLAIKYNDFHIEFLQDVKEEIEKL